MSGFHGQKVHGAHIFAHMTQPMTVHPPPGFIGHGVQPQYHQVYPQMYAAQSNLAARRQDCSAGNPQNDIRQHSHLRPRPHVLQMHRYPDQQRHTSETTNQLSQNPESGSSQPLNISTSVTESHVPDAGGSKNDQSVLLVSSPHSDVQSCDSESDLCNLPDKTYPYTTDQTSKEQDAPSRSGDRNRTGIGGRELFPDNVYPERHFTVYQWKKLHILFWGKAVRQKPMLNW